jgi:transposase
MVNLGIDLHKTQFTVCVRVHGKEVFQEYSTKPEGYEEFLSQVSKWQKKGRRVKVGVESTGNTRYFKNRMEAAGVKVVVINTLRFKIVNESVNKTDEHDAATILTFLDKDMLPQAHLCSQDSEDLRRLLKVRTTLVRTMVTVKNQIHAMLTALGMEDVRASLQSKRGRQKALDTLKERNFGLVAQPLFDTIDRIDESVKKIEDELTTLTKDDPVVKLLMTIPGCGEISAWTIRAYTDDIKRFASAKKYSSYAGLAPWVQNSNETVHIGKITKRGPEELRTALVQVVMGILRCKKSTISWRMVRHYDYMKPNKGSGKSIIAMARKVATVIWKMLTDKVEFNPTLMVDKKAEKIADKMRNEKSKEKENSETANEQNKSSEKKNLGVHKIKHPVKNEKKSGFSGKKLKKVG